MASGASVEVRNLKEVEEYVRTIGEEAFPRAKGIFQKAVINAANEVKEMKKLRVRSGALKRSIGQEVGGTDLKTLKASIYSKQGSESKQVLYAPVQEFGHPGIKPIDKYKKIPGGPYMNIPTDDNQTPAGVMRMAAREVFRDGGYVRGIGRNRYGVFLGSKMMFFLTKGPIILSPRLGMRDAADDEVPTLLSNLANAVIEE